MKTRASVLVIDDEVEYVEMLRIRLEDAGLMTDVATSGQEGLAKAEAGAYDVILLDLTLGDISGFLVLQRLRASPATRHTPVIILSARSDSKAIMQTQEAGATDYIIKSEDSATLVTTVRRHLSR
ncbi:MAG: Transcriptional activator protein CzcR [Lentisphaerae bacterium ADurb.BinA184]|nr:MAG: Transcriptional activator protein CzcR [Lentisphaerae bacterium ADurb.BinA184]